jgi:lipoate-protein ligase A
MYALVLGYGEHGYGAHPAMPVQSLPDINEIHRFVLGRIVQSLSTLTTDRGQGDIVQAGISDLTIRARCPQWGETRLHKFSGNSLRCKRTHFLYHGTLLYDFDLPRISRWLKMPPRLPGYRSARSHDTFLANLPVTRDQIAQALIRGWQAQQPLDDWPRERTARLVHEKYSADPGTRCPLILAPRS